MLCDSPVHYEREKESTEFIACVPTVWDETVAIDGKVGEYIVLARRSGDRWYIAGMNAHNEQTVNVDLSVFGGAGKKLEMFRDGANAHRYGDDYMKVVSETGESLTVTMKPGGGFVAIVY